MRRLLCTLCLLSIAHAAVADDERDAYYAITIDGNLVGYAAAASEPAEHDGEPVVRFQSETSLKIALLGKERNTLLQSETLLRPESFEPISFKVTDTTGDVVSHIECAFSPRSVRMWKYREGEPKGEPAETRLPEGTLVLGGNDFGHWGLVVQSAAARAKDGAATVPVFIPQAQQVQSFRFQRGESTEIDVAGTTKTAVQWNVANQGIVLYVDPQTNRFLRMDIPAQRTTIALADAAVVKAAQKARAEEVLMRHFAQTDVTFDDYLKVRQLEAEIDVEVLGAPAAQLSDAMQQFDGTRDGSHLAGKLVVTTKPYDGKGAPAFPYAQLDRTRFPLALAPSPYIESDHEAIVAKASELTAGAATTWEATRRIAGWVHENVLYTIADTPSARLALEKRTGDCGPHSTLTIAMLRAAGIPARLVGGLLYTPSFGGSFGQHAWVEVYMGDDGWVPVDPTTGELGAINATHLKLFDGLGGVIPKSVKVVRFEPPNQDAPVGQAPEAKALPWKLKQEYVFDYVQGDQPLGTERFTVTKVEHDGADAYELKSTLDLKVGGAAVSGTTTLVVTPAALPLSFQRDLDAAGTKAKIECTFEDEKVDARISGAVDVAREIKLGKGTYCSDNNLLAAYALICAQLDLEPNKELKIRAFHPSILQVVPLTFKVGSLEAVTIGAKELMCYPCQVVPLKNTFWISEDGRFVKAQQGNLVIQLKSIE